MRRVRLTAILGALLLLAAVACGGETTGESAPQGSGNGDSNGAEQGEGLLGAVQAAGILRVSTDPAYPPQSSLNSDGEFEGFDIDVATEIAKRLGVEVEWKTPSWDVITAGNWSGRWDASVGSMTVTPERSEVLHFTPAYYYTPASVAVHTDNTDITDVETDLDGKRIGVCAGCTYDAYLEKSLNIPGEEIEFLIDDAQIKGYDTDTSAINDLEIGDGERLDAVMSALPTLEGAIEKDKPIKIVGDPVFYEPLAVAIDRNAPEDPMPLVEAITEIIHEMHSDGTLSELSMKWYGTDLTQKV
jgi:polar amino acid transport system substrate-binding protein